jgi:hypothetical protein
VRVQEQAYSTRHIRSGFLVFAAGKAISIPGSLALVFVLAAVMPRPEYAAYVAATALLEILLAVGTMGLDWLTQTVIPGVRINGTPSQTRRAVRLLTAAGAAPFLVLGPLLWWFSQPASAIVGGVAPPELLELYGMLLAVEGAGRAQRDQVLGALLKQGAVQGVVVFRIVALLGTAAVLHWGGWGVTAMAVARVELFVSIVGMIVGLVVMWRYTRALTPQAGEAATLSRWLSRDSVRFAANAYGSLLLSIGLGGDLAIALVARTLGEESTATVGFALRLVAQVRRLLPIDLFWSVIRPAVIGRFERGGRVFEALRFDLTQVLRLNLAALGAVAVLAIGVADPLVRSVTRGQIDLPPLLLASLLVQVLGHGMRRPYELVCFTVGHAGLFLRASLASLLVPPLLLTLLHATESLFALPIAFAVAELLFLAAARAGLAARGYPFGLPGRSWLALSASVTAGSAVTFSLARVWPDLPGLVSAGVVGILAYVAIAHVAGFLRMTEIVRLLTVFRAPGLAPAVRPD